MKSLLSILSILILVSSCATSTCSSTNASCTFGATNSSAEINILGLGNSTFKKRNYEAAIICDLSPDPILIENINAEVIEN